MARVPDYDRPPKKLPKKPKPRFDGEPIKSTYHKPKKKKATKTESFPMKQNWHW